MFGSYFNSLVFQCLIQLKEERTVYSVFHILSGKKSSQTIQDCHLYGLNKYFRTYPSLSREAFDHIISSIVKQQFIEIKDNGHYKLTQKGLGCFELYNRSSSPLIHINGFKYHMISGVFWRRLSLLFQVLSNSVHNQTKYYVIQRSADVQKWVKSFLNQHESKLMVAESLYNEMIDILGKMSELQARIFMLKMSGYHRVGYSNQQIGEQVNEDEISVHYLFLDTLHFLLSMSSEKPMHYPTLAAIFNDNQMSRTTLTQSSDSTLRLIRKGFLIEDIARIRKLKKNTIEDHIVEITLHTADFDISPFISESLIQEIHLLSNTMKTKQLKSLKQGLPDYVSFFQIRLALAKGGAPK